MKNKTRPNTEEVVNNHLGGLGIDGYVSLWRNRLYPRNYILYVGYCRPDGTKAYRNNGSIGTTARAAIQELNHLRGLGAI